MPSVSQNWDGARWRGGISSQVQQRWDLRAGPWLPWLTAAAVAWCLHVVWEGTVCGPVHRIRLKSNQPWPLGGYVDLLNLGRRTCMVIIGGRGLRIHCPGNKTPYPTIRSCLVLNDPIFLSLFHEGNAFISQRCAGVCSLWPPSQAFCMSLKKKHTATQKTPEDVRVGHVVWGQHPCSGPTFDGMMV